MSVSTCYQNIASRKDHGHLKSFKILPDKIYIDMMAPHLVNIQYLYMWYPCSHSTNRFRYDQPSQLRFKGVIIIYMKNLFHKHLEKRSLHFGR